MGFCNVTALNCSSWHEHHDIRKIHADPDIAGIGITFAFIATAFVTIVSAHLSYCLGIIRRRGSNTIDAWISTKLQKVSCLQVNEQRTRFWQPIIERLVMALSDQQLLVGIAILIAGFASHCTITVYHFSMASFLAWFSANTHFVSLDVLQVYLADRPSLRTWRVGFLLIMLIAMIVATVLRGHERWQTSANSPAHCLFSDLPGNIKSANTKRMAIDISLLLYGYGVAIARLYNLVSYCPLPKDQSANSTQGPRAAIKLYKGFRPLSSGPKAYFLFLVLRPAKFVLIVGRDIYFAICTCLSCVPALMCRDVAWFVYGVRNIMVGRKNGATYMDGDENAWGFGQMTAVLLLSSIILTLRDIYTEQKAKAGNGNAGGIIEQFELQNIQTTPTNFDVDFEEPEAALLPPTRVDTEAGGRDGLSTSVQCQMFGAHT